MRQSKALPETTSIRLSAPKPIIETLPASAPATTATSASILFQAMVKYSSFRPLLMAFRWCLTVVGTGLEYNALIAQSR